MQIVTNPTHDAGNVSIITIIFQGTYSMAPLLILFYDISGVTIIKGYFLRDLSERAAILINKHFFIQIFLILGLGYITEQ